MGIFSKVKRAVLGEQRLDQKAYDQNFIALYEVCKAYTMTSIERMFSLYNAVNYVLDNNIKGDFVECGVWKGGSSLLMAMILEKRGVTDRKIYLYDTYDGMVEPSEVDLSFNGESATEIFNKEDKWCYSALDEVKNNIARSNISEEQIVFVKGKVEDTIPGVIPDNEIALLRLDTDWYESTKHELENLYPKLINQGVMIIDDYGHWEGARKAVDEYFQKMNWKPLLNRIDYSGRIMLKP